MFYFYHLKASGQTNLAKVHYPAQCKEYTQQFVTAANTFEETCEKHSLTFLVNHPHINDEHQLKFVCPYEVTTCPLVCHMTTQRGLAHTTGALYQDTLGKLIARVGREEKLGVQVASRGGNVCSSSSVLPSNYVVHIRKWLQPFIRWSTYQLISLFKRCPRFNEIWT